MRYRPLDGDKLGFDFSGSGYIAPGGHNLAFSMRLHPELEPPPYLPPQGEKVGFSFLEPGYIAPVGDILGFAFDSGRYIPPAGSEIALNFSGAYEPPAGNSVALEFVPSGDGPSSDNQYLFPLGERQTVFGASEVKLYTRYVDADGTGSTLSFGVQIVYNSDSYLHPTGFSHTGMGSPEVENRFPDVFPSGWRSSSVSTGPNIWNLTQAIQSGSWSSARVGRPSKVWNLTQITAPGGIAAPPLSGPNEFRLVPSPWISFWTRYLDVDDKNGGIRVPNNQVPNGTRVTGEIQFVSVQNRGISAGRYGTPRIGYAVRELHPQSILPRPIPLPNIAFILEVFPVGWQSIGLVSENARLDINLQRIHHHSGVGDQAAYGELVVRNQHEFVKPGGWTSAEINFPIVYNFDQHLQVAPYMDTNSDPTQWPNWAPWVENQTRYLGPGGFISSRFSFMGHNLRNGAEPVLPPGLDATLWGAGTFISHENRPVEAVGWESFYSSRYTAVYNKADLTIPTSWQSSQFGTPSQVLNLNREVKHHSGPDGADFGTSYIDFGVRTVYPSLFYRTPSGYPEVRWNPYPLAPEGIDSYRTGGHFLQEVFQTLHPWPANMPSALKFGEPVLTSTNREVHPRQIVDDLYGIPRVFNSDQYLPIPPFEELWWGFGLHNISYRDKTLFPVPLPLERITNLHRVKNELPDPPQPRSIYVSSIYIGNAQRPGVVPNPVLNVRTIFAFGMAPPTGFAGPFIRSNVLEVQPYTAVSVFGTPFIPHTLYVTARSVPTGSGGDSDQFNRDRRVARLSPHNIYAPLGEEASTQYRSNHPTGTRHRIDYYVLDNNPNGRGFGRPRATNQHRAIYGIGAGNQMRMGTPRVDITQRFVSPRTWRSERFGMAMFLDVPQYIGFTWYGGFNSLVTGRPVVSRPPAPPTPPRPVGWQDSRFGNTYVENFHREFSVPGIPHRGNPQQGNTNPWGRPLVGFPREYEMGGWDFTLWGTAWISHRIRNVDPEGWQSSVAEADMPSWFRDRGRVTRRNPPGGIPGIESTVAFGLALVAFFTRHILSRGISSYNSGYHAVNTVAKIAPAGWDSFEAGDIDRWEAGKIKAHGDDLSSVGTPRTRFRVIPTGPSESVVGQPRVGSLAYPLGIPEIGFAGPSISNPFGCTNRVVTPLPILSQQNVPKPVVNAA